MKLHSSIKLLKCLHATDPLLSIPATVHKEMLIFLKLRIEIGH